MMHTHDKTRKGVKIAMGDRDLELTECSRCGQACYAPHADVVMGVQVVCSRSHEPREFTIRVLEPARKRAIKYAKPAKRQTNARADAAAAAADGHNVPFKRLLSSKLDTATLEKLLALKQDLES